MEQDAVALESAYKAYTAFINNNADDCKEVRTHRYPNGDAVKNNDGSDATYIYYNEAMHIAAAKAKQEEVRRNEDCELWND